MKNTFRKLISKHFFLVIFLFFYFSVICFKLVSHPTPFYDWDESINAEVGKEMIESKSLVPLWQGETWLDKPPLPFLFFGIVMKLTPFILPEVSLRVTSLFLSLISLVFIYAVFHKATQDKLIPLLAVMITAFTPIFLQRSQILNLDVFLLIGWLGYLIFFQNFWTSLFFLIISVLTKSLIGFYPVGIILIYSAYLYLVKKMKTNEFKTVLRKIAFHLSLMSIWYIIMLTIYKDSFFQQHIVETHFRRVTASIESHFGQRTYYVDLLFQELGIFTWLSLLGLGIVILNVVKNLSTYLRKSYIRERFIGLSSQDDKLLFSLFLLPWFIFLNLTKTKIFWYLYPAISQFAFLAVYPLTFLSKQRFKLISYLISLILIFFLFYQNFIKINFFSTLYSKHEDHYRLALYAKDRCKLLSVLVSKEKRDAVKTLENLGLTITSTKQWGDFPSIVYYFGKHVDFYYDIDFFKSQVDKMQNNPCLVIYKNDLEAINLVGRSELSNFGSLVLY